MQTLYGLLYMVTLTVVVTLLSGYMPGQHGDCIIIIMTGCAGGRAQESTRACLKYV